MINLYGQEITKLEKLLMDRGQKKYRATQLFTWIYEKKAKTFDEMSDVSKAFRDELNRDFCLTLPTIYKKQVSKDGTIKLLLELEDGSKIETALMPYNYGNAVCVTSQVGCNMGCAFCASGLLKKKRNLEVHEIVGQVLVMNSLLEEKGEHVSHIVVMGTGEPFDNYDNVMDFIRIVNHPKALAIGARHISVSTCGLVPGIMKYAHEGLQTNLAISLHAPNDEIRNKLMPVSRAYPMDKLMEAVKYYEQTAGRRVTFEYIMLEGINDTLECAKELVNLVKGTLAYVNLIPYNPVDEHDFKRSNDKNVHKFFSYLMQHGVNTTVRKEFGNDIDAACGQLRAKEMKKDASKR
ncbi:MAG: 23S rRNA (adenine(2503)-C(2))-methyltransferase RlmN [Firmicutes bacterium]|nr:23S rRNA (adenine(2503)-C(2))-methyltransferase RlmN [Candidatus Fiminaster equi]